jgi:hypothetical protein
MELISWIATLIILLSFFFEGKKLRLINGLGAVLWTLWGIGVGEAAVVFLNVMIVGIHAYKLSIEGGENSFSTEIKKRLGKIF